MIRWCSGGGDGPIFSVDWAGSLELESINTTGEYWG